MTGRKNVAIVGSGPGGLSAGMILASRGHRVTVFEKDDRPGGRNGEIVKNGYRFDIGPTFLLYKELMDEIFAEAGEDTSEYMDFEKLEPMYDLWFRERRLSVYSNPQKMEEELRRVYPDSVEGYREFRRGEKQRFEFLKPCLKKHYSSLRELVDVDLMKALPYLGIGRSVFQQLQTYFQDEDLTLSFCFQSKYLGMSAWDCPAMFGIIPHLEHEYGIYHVRGGLSEITRSMAKSIQKNGGEVRLNSPVKQVLVENSRAWGLELESGEIFECDQLVLNADFAYAMTNLVKQKDLTQYKREKINKLKYSCSTFMLYLGLDKIYDVPHHNIVFAKEYKKNVEEIFHDYKLSEDCSFYVRNASINDSTLAPEGHSALYVLVPVPNMHADVDWEEQKERFREFVLDLLQERLELSNIRAHIQEEVIMTPKDWRDKMNVYLGATFNLAHSWDQIAMFRPKNAFTEVKGCYLAGGGTHPGSGLPTIFESGRIAAQLIEENYH